MEQNWRTDLASSRYKIVQRLMDTLIRLAPLSGQNSLTELWNIAKQFEETIFYAASDQDDYLREISKILNLETRTQNAPNDALPTSSTGASSIRPLDTVGTGDSLQQVGQPGVMDQADIVWSKMQTLKDMYLQDMKDLYNILTIRSQQYMPEDHLQKLTHYKNVLQRMMPYLVAAKGSLPKEFKQDKVEAFERQIVSIMELFKRRRQALQQGAETGSAAR